LPNSEKLRETVVLLPFFHGMTDAEQERVIQECSEVARAIASG
jgi:dTDP-4-amino-4,6-dideoxygalactose transaminase